MSGVPAPVGEYVDANGNTFQMTADRAKALGFKPVPTAAKAVKADDVEDKSTARRSASHK